LDDATAWVAIAGIAGTLGAAIFAPIVGEIARRKSVRKERFLELRLEAYADLLRVGSRFVNNAITLASMPDADVTEPDNDELGRLDGLVRLVASKDAARHFTAFYEQLAKFHAELLVMRMTSNPAPAHNREDAAALRVAKDANRLALAREADALRGTFRELEAAIRKDVQV
jgi:hypothetical protein